MESRDLRAADRLALFLVGYGFGIGSFVALALAFPLEAFSRVLPGAFVPTLGELIQNGEVGRLAVHALYAAYGGLMMGLGFLLHRKVMSEAVRTGLPLDALTIPRSMGGHSSTLNST